MNTLLIHWTVLSSVEIDELVQNRGLDSEDAFSHPVSGYGTEDQGLIADGISGLSYPNPHRRIEYTNMFRRMDFDGSGYVEKAFVEATFIQRGLISFHKIRKLMAHEYEDAATWKEFLVLMHFRDMLTSGNLDKVPGELPPAYWEGLDEILER